MKESKQPNKSAYCSLKMIVVSLSDNDVITESVGTFSVKDDVPFQNSWLSE